MRILLVDDEKEFADMLRWSECFVVDHADRLTMAREAAPAGSSDLILPKRLSRLIASDW